MATGSVISLCNRALLSIGARAQISSLTEGSTESDACSVLYTPTFESLARTAHWNCLRKQASLSLLAAAAGTPENLDGTTLPLPPQPWLYSYALPNDCLQARFIMPNANATPTGVPLTPATQDAPWYVYPVGQMPYYVAYDTDANNSPIQVVLTNVAQAILVYTVNQPNPQVWDSDLQQAFVASLAAYLVPALSLNMPLMRMQVELADRIIANARARDANENYNNQTIIPDWIRARNTGGLGYYGVGQGFGSGWVDMSWPG